MARRNNNQGGDYSTTAVKQTCATGCYLDKRVAIKVPKLELSPAAPGGTSAIDRFLEEGRRMATLGHPYVITVLDAAPDRTAGCLLVMEYVEGRTLEQLIRTQNGRPLPVSRAIRLIARVTAGIEHAHEKQVFHRDLKPANILLDLNGKPRITDFGLALRRFELLEHAGECAGTPAYMAPEQWREAVQDMDDGKADVWAMGVILYELLTGNRPFASKRAEELKHQILGQSPTSLRHHNLSVGYKLEALCLQCLDKRAAGRPTAAEFVRALRRTGEELDREKKGKDRPLDREKLEYREGLLKSILDKSMASYSTVKKARRLMRAQGLVSQKNSEVPLVVVATYDKYMEVVIETQLELENLVREVETSRVAFTKPAELAEAVKSMEVYLSMLIQEFETVRPLLQPDKPPAELATLPYLDDFLRSARESQFMTMMIIPHRAIKKLIRDDLLHPLLPTPAKGNEA